MMRPKDHMFAVQEVSLGTVYEELAAVGILSRIDHGQNAIRVVLHDEVSIVNGVLVNRWSFLSLNFDLGW